MDPSNNFHSTVLGRSSDDGTTANGSNGDSDRPRRRAIDILNPEPEPEPATSSPYPSRHRHQHSYASSTASSSHRAHDTFALRSPTKAEFRPLVSPSARQASPASIGPAVTNLLNNSPPLQHRPPPSSVSRSRSPHLAPPSGASAASTPYSAHGDAQSAPREQPPRKFYDPTTDTTTATATGAAPSAVDRHTSGSRSRRDDSQVSLFYDALSSSRLFFPCAFVILIALFAPSLPRLMFSSCLSPICSLALERTHCCFVVYLTLSCSLLSFALPCPLFPALFVLVGSLNSQTQKHGT